MAKSLRAQFEEHLTCSICLEHLQDPKVLPCLHTYCHGCIRKLDMTRNILTCPDCRLTTKVPHPPDVSYLPSNFFVNNLLATLSSADGSGKPGFGLCEKCNAKQAETRCDQCVQNLCQSCTQAHKGSRHNLRTLAVSKSRDFPVAPDTVYCTKHPGQSVTIFCKTCQETICCDCVRLNHQRHNRMFVSEAVSAKKAELMKLVEDVKRRTNEISTKLCSLKEKEETLNKTNQLTVQQIEAHFTSLVDVLVSRKEKLIATVKSSPSNRLKQLQRQQEDLQIMVASCESSVSFTEQTIRNSNDVKLLDSAKYMSESLKSSKDQKIEDENPVDDGCLVFDKKLTTEEFSKQIEQACIVRERGNQHKSQSPVARTIASVVSTFAHVQAGSTAVNTATNNKVSNPKSTAKLFPSGSLVGNRIFRPGFHCWDVEIDHSNCPGRDRADFQIGVISHRNGSTVTLGGFIKPGRCEDFHLELDSYDDNLRIEAPWDDDIDFDVYEDMLSPYLEIDCKHCDVNVTDQDFFWEFERQ